MLEQYSTGGHGQGARLQTCVLLHVLQKGTFDREPQPLHSHDTVRFLHGVVFPLCFRATLLISDLISLVRAVFGPLQQGRKLYACK